MGESDGIERRIDYKKGKPSPLSNDNKNHLINYSWYCEETLFLASFLGGRETESIKDDPVYESFMSMGYLTKGFNPVNRIPESKLTTNGIKEFNSRRHKLLDSNLIEYLRIVGRIWFNI